MRKLLAVIIVFLPLIVVRLAFGADAAATAAAQSGMIGVSWETALTVYGPMGVIIIWFMVRERKRDERLFALVEKCTGVMANVETALTKTSADSDKQRTAIYQLRDAVRDFGTNVASISTRGKVRGILRDEEGEA